LTLTTFAETEARLLAISCAPFACCSTAEAMRTEKPFSSRIVRDIPAIASTAAGHILDRVDALADV